MLFILVAASPERDTHYITAEYALSGLRGLWTGFLRGLMRDSKMEISDKCLNETLASEFDFFIDSIKEQKITSVYELLGMAEKFLKVVNYMDYCNFENTTSELRDYCAVDPFRCELKTIWFNFNHRME